MGNKIQNFKRIEGPEPWPETRMVSDFIGWITQGLPKNTKPKHTKFWGQSEVEEHSAAVAGNKVCYFCLAELEEKYGIDVAIKQGYIPYK